MKGNYLAIFIVSAAFFTLAATHRFNDSAHAIGTIKKGGGTARHPALLNKNSDSYILIATAGVSPPYQGNARVVLEGAPHLSATFHNSEPAVNLGLFRHPEFRDNTYFDLRPKDRIALWVKIKRDRAIAQPQAAAAKTVQAEHNAHVTCSQCDPEENAQGMKGATVKSSAETPVKAERHAETTRTAGLIAGRQNRGDTLAYGNGRRGEGSVVPSAPEPALAFYDSATNEPLLKIPIQFIGSGGGYNEH